MKRALALLCGVLLVGCGSTKEAETPITNNKQTVENNKQEIEEQQEQAEITEEATTVEETTQLNKEELEDAIRIESENFIADMDEIFINLAEYEGKVLTYEGLLIQDEEEQYAVVRTYELDHGDHSHSIYVGMDASYTGEWPEEESWVRVTGTIQRTNEGGDDYPILSIDTIEALPQRGQVMVYN